MSSPITRSPIRLSVVLLCILLVVYYMYGSKSSLDKNKPYSRSNFTKAGSKRTLKILCFGDSLTAGQRPRQKSKPLTFHSYSTKLEKLLQKGLQFEQRLRGFDSVLIHNRGKPGELAVGAMKRRLIGLLKGNHTYDLVIILGGTNDLGYLKKKPLQAPNVTTILKALVELHDLCHYFKVKTFVATIPPPLCELEKKCMETAARRRFLNVNLFNYATRSTSKAVFVDLARYFESVKLFSDFVHFTDYGYDKMADIFYYLIKEKL